MSLCAESEFGVSKTLNHLGVFAKYWEPGSVKTRLAVSIGNSMAASFYRECVRQTLVRFGETGDARSIWVSPPGNHQEFDALSKKGNWTIDSQSSGDLGERMSDFFQQTLASNRGNNGESNNRSSRCILIGTDSPSLPTEFIQQAFSQLKTYDCVLGPSADGGYYLIGMAKFIPELFHKIAWSTEQVFQQSVEILESNQFTWAALPTWNDIDDESDLHWLAGQLQNSSTETSDSEESDPDIESLKLDQQLLQAVQLALANSNRSDHSHPEDDPPA